MWIYCLVVIDIQALHPLFIGIATAAIEWISGQDSLSTCRKVEIMSDAAHAILKYVLSYILIFSTNQTNSVIHFSLRLFPFHIRRDAKNASNTGNFFIDDEVLLSEGLTISDLDKYAVSPGSQLMVDFFLDEETPRVPKSKL